MGAADLDEIRPQLGDELTLQLFLFLIDVLAIGTRSKIEHDRTALMPEIKGKVLMPSKMLIEH